MADSQLIIDFVKVSHFLEDQIVDLRNSIVEWNEALRYENEYIEAEYGDPVGKFMTGVGPMDDGILWQNDMVEDLEPFIVGHSGGASADIVSVKNPLRGGAPFLYSTCTHLLAYKWLWRAIRANRKRSRWIIPKFHSGMSSSDLPSMYVNKKIDISNAKSFVEYGTHILQGVDRLVEMIRRERFLVQMNAGTSPETVRQRESIQKKTRKRNHHFCNNARRAADEFKIRINSGDDISLKSFCITCSANFGLSWRSLYDKLRKNHSRWDRTKQYFSPNNSESK